MTWFQRSKFWSTWKTQRRDFLKDLVQAAKPGGRIFVAVPLIPSAALEVPALPINMPPHHLTFWTMPALAHAFGKFGLKILTHQAVPPGPAESFLFWARRFSWIRDQNGFARLDVESEEVVHRP